MLRGCRPASGARPPELVLVVAGERVGLHGAIAAARSPLLRRQLLGPWGPQVLLGVRV